jgi:hypothetical protein
MLSVQRLRELFSSLRFRLVLWITLVVFLMVVVTYITVRAVEQQTLRAGYDQFCRRDGKLSGEYDAARHGTQQKGKG